MLYSSLLPNAPKGEFCIDEVHGFAAHLPRFFLMREDFEMAFAHGAPQQHSREAHVSQRCPFASGRREVDTQINTTKVNVDHTTDCFLKEMADEAVYGKLPSLGLLDNRITTAIREVYVQHVTKTFVQKIQGLCHDKASAARKGECERALLLSGHIEEEKARLTNLVIAEQHHIHSLVHEIQQLNFKSDANNDLLPSLSASEMSLQWLLLDIGRESDSKSTSRDYDSDAEAAATHAATHLGNDGLKEGNIFRKKVVSNVLSQIVQKKPKNTLHKVTASLKTLKQGAAHKIDTKIASPESSPPGSPRNAGVFESVVFSSAQLVQDLQYNYEGGIRPSVPRPPPLPPALGANDVLPPPPEPEPEPPSENASDQPEGEIVEAIEGRHERDSQESSSSSSSEGPPSPVSENPSEVESAFDVAPMGEEAETPQAEEGDAGTDGNEEGGVGEGGDETENGEEAETPQDNNSTTTELPEDDTTKLPEQPESDNETVNAGTIADEVEGLGDHAGADNENFENIADVDDAVEVKEEEDEDEEGVEDSTATPDPVLLLILAEEEKTERCRRRSIELEESRVVHYFKTIATALGKGEVPPWRDAVKTNVVSNADNEIDYPLPEYEYETQEQKEKNKKKKSKRRRSKTERDDWKATLAATKRGNKLAETQRKKRGGGVAPTVASPAFPASPPLSPKRMGHSPSARASLCTPVVPDVLLDTTQEIVNKEKTEKEFMQNLQNELAKQMANRKVKQGQSIRDRMQVPGNANAIVPPDEQEAVAAGLPQRGHKRNPLSHKLKPMAPSSYELQQQEQMQQVAAGRRSSEPDPRGNDFSPKTKVQHSVHNLQTILNTVNRGRGTAIAAPKLKPLKKAVNSGVIASVRIGGKPEKNIKNRLPPLPI